MAEKTRIRMTIQDFMERYDAQPFEIIDGEIIEMAPTKKQHSKVSKRIYDRLFLFLVQNDFGEVFMETTYIREDRPDWVSGSRVPDIMFYERDRFDAHERENPDDAGKPFFIVPDLVVEVISPTDKYFEVNQKVDAYLEDGVRLLWIIDPENKTIAVYAGSDSPKILREKDTLSGGDVLPGFSLAVGEVFGG